MPGAMRSALKLVAAWRLHVTDDDLPVQHLQAMNQRVYFNLKAFRMRGVYAAEQVFSVDCGAKPALKALPGSARCGQIRIEHAYVFGARAT